MPSDHFDDDDDDRPRRRRDRNDDENDDGGPFRRRDSGDDDDHDRDEYESRRSWRDEEEDYDDRPRGRRRRGEGLAITSMILGILSIVFACCCGLFSLPLSATAVILGFVDRSQNGPNGKATAGIICGFVAILLAILAVIANLFLNVGQQWNPQAGKFGN